MKDRYFIPWIGKGFGKSRTLLLSESAYDWPDENGVMLTPQPAHPSDSLLWHIDNLHNNRFFTCINQALCMRSEPSVAEMRSAWDGLAYSIFVQRTVGVGPGVRPTAEQWREAGPNFLTLVEELRPSRVIVVGKEMWKRMPECSTRLLDDLQAYELSDGHLTWCLALPHPANRTDGFQWQVVGRSIDIFQHTIFPNMAY